MLSPSSGLPLLAKTITHPAARSLCDSWASCSLSFCRDIPLLFVCVAFYEAVEAASLPVCLASLLLRDSELANVTCRRRTTAVVIHRQRQLHRDHIRDLFHCYRFFNKWRRFRTLKRKRKWRPSELLMRRGGGGALCRR